MQFIRADVGEGIASLRQCLHQALKQGESTLWLVPGGSNIPIVVQLMAEVSDELSRYLTIMLTDERFGPVGHPDSNAEQLYKAGFHPKQATFIPVLVGQTLAATVTRYAHTFDQQLSRARHLIGQFGMGADGHIAGILPHSVATSETHTFASGYEGPDFTRVTLTFPALRCLQVAYAFVYGSNKQPALQLLRDEERPMDEQPAQILKHIPQTYIYNDQVGEKAE